VGDVQRRVEGCAFGVLKDMIRPEGLGAVRGFDGFERFLVGVGGRERNVLGRVPVLGEDDVVEFFGEGVDEGNDGIAIFDS